MTVSTAHQELTMRSVQGDYFLALSRSLAASWHTEIASVFPTDQASEDYPWLGAVPNLVKWEGPRTVQRLREDKVTIVNDDYETGIEFRRKDFRRDKTRQMQARVGDMAGRVATFPCKLLSDLIKANGNAYDGVALYSGSHVVGSSGTIDNDVVAADGLAGGAAPTTAQMSTNLLIVLSRMMGFLDDRGEPLNETAREFAVMVPPNLWGPTVAAITAAFTSSAASNPLVELAKKGVRMNPILNARLTTTNQFHMFRTDAGIRPFIVQEEWMEPVTFGPDSEHAKKTNKLYFGHSWTGGAGYGRFELAARGTTS